MDAAQTEETIRSLLTDLKEDKANWSHSWFKR